MAMIKFEVSMPDGSKYEVEAPEGTAALPIIPFSVTTSTSTVGFPLESSICLAWTFNMILIFIVFIGC